MRIWKIFAKITGLSLSMSFTLIITIFYSIYFINILSVYAAEPLLSFNAIETNIKTINYNFYLISSYNCECSNIPTTVIIIIIFIVLLIAVGIIALIIENKRYWKKHNKNIKNNYSSNINQKDKSDFNVISTRKDPNFTEPLTEKEKGEIKIEPVENLDIQPKLTPPVINSKILLPSINTNKTNSVISFNAKCINFDKLKREIDSILSTFSIIQDFPNRFDIVLESNNLGWSFFTINIDKDFFNKLSQVFPIIEDKGLVYWLKEKIEQQKYLLNECEWVAAGSNESIGNNSFHVYYGSLSSSYPVGIGSIGGAGIGGFGGGGGCGC